MKKIFILGLIVFLAVISSFVLVNSQTNPITYAECIKKCNGISHESKEICIYDLKNQSKECNDEFKLCLLNSKNLNITKRDSMRIIRECANNLTICRKESQNIRNSCIKTALNDSKTCKESCQELIICPAVNVPVCGKDNKTYANECELRKTNVEKACNGECPCGIIKPVKNYCSSTNIENPVCPTLYDPVCGWFNRNIICIAYPCAATYSNSCTACLDSKVNFWTPGECPNFRSTNQAQ